MQVTQTQNEGFKRGYRFVLPAAELDERVEAMLTAEQRNFQLKGFRKGKVPISLIRRMNGKRIDGEIREEAIRETLIDHFKDADEKPAEAPRIDVESVDLDQGEDLTFSITYEAQPKIPDIDFKSIELERLVVVPEEDLIQNVLEFNAKRYGTFEDAEPAAKAEQGDMVVLDFTGSIDGEEFEDGSGEGFPVKIGDDMIAPGLDAHLIGAQVGLELDARVEYPDDYRIEAYQGKEAVFSCKVQGLKKLVPAPIDDDLAAKVHAGGLDDLKEAIRKEFETGYNRESKFELRFKLFNRLAEMLDFELPPDLLKTESRNVARQFKADEGSGNEDMDGGPSKTSRVDAEVDDQGDEASSLGAKSEEERTDGDRNVAVSTDDGAGENEGTDGDADAGGVSEELASIEPTEEHIDLAKRRLRLAMLFRKVGVENGIRVTELDLRAEADRLARQDGLDTSKTYMQMMEAIPRIRANVEQRIFESKITDFLLELVQFTDREVSYDELKEALEAID